MSGGSKRRDKCRSLTYYIRFGEMVGEVPEKISSCIGGVGLYILLSPYPSPGPNIQCSQEFSVAF